MSVEDGRDILNVVVCGHVDAGKSTLVGHLLYRLKHVSDKEMHKFKQESEKIGKGSFAYAWIMDEGSEERTRGVTMDVSHRQFNTDRYMVNIIDSPGHRDFVPNMLLGASQADVALLVVDSSQGEFEVGISEQGQTREHVILVKSLGIHSVIVVVNKMERAGWAKDRYTEIISSLANLLKSVGLKPDSVTYVPCSGLEGINTTARDNGTKMPWYDGGCLINAIDAISQPARSDNPDLVRFFVSDVFKPQGSGVNCQGKLESGRMAKGNKVVVYPDAFECQIKDLSGYDGQTDVLNQGDIATVTLIGPSISLDNFKIGCVIANAEHPVPCGKRFRCRLLVLTDQPLIKGLPVIFHHKLSKENATIRKLESQLNKKNGEVVKKHPRCLIKKNVGVVQIELTGRAVCVETTETNNLLCRFTVRSSGQTIGTGVITKVLSCNRSMTDS